MSEKAIKEYLEKLRKLFDRKYFKISELDKEQHRLKGVYERLMGDLRKHRKSMVNATSKEMRKFDGMTKTLVAEIQAVKGEKTLLTEMRLKIKMMEMDYAKLMAELAEIEAGE